MDNRFEDLLNKAATLYVEREGGALLCEDTAAVPEPVFKVLWRKIRSRLFYERARRTAFVGLPVAACLLLAVFLARPFVLQPSPDTNTMSDASEYPRVEIALLSTKLPDGCILTETDYDHGKTIYHIVNGLGNEIVLTVEQTDIPLVTDGFALRSVNDTDIYMMARRDYNVLIALSDGIQYTITNAFDAEDLIEIAQSIL